MSPSTPGRHRRTPARLRPRHAAVVVATITVTMGGGIAVAAWTSSGSGEATAKAGTATAPTTGSVPGSAVTEGLLYPDGPAGTAKILVHNPNPYPVKVTTVNADVTAPTASGGTGTCVTTGVSWNNRTLSGGNAVPANGSATLTLPGAVVMSSASENGCQGAVFTIPVTVTVMSG
ncbi:hypothetical protein ACIA2T_33695 [Amycolatopsis japonica]|uniref:hypothetical protein n=1 Tax=Amycolatopsis japonica TaxID=208439 RepID=UPI00379623CA